MKWILIESNTPSTDEFVDLSWSDSDKSNEYFVPTIEFAKKVYDRANKELFFNNLPTPNELEFKIENRIRHNVAGYAKSKIDDIMNTLVPSALVLNGARTLTGHSWVEVIIHEMIHICDYVNNPDKFLAVKYEAHDDWFMKEARRFKKYGFNITKTLERPYKLNTDDKRISRMVGKYIFIKIGHSDGVDVVIQIALKDKEKWFGYFRGNGLKRLTLMTSDNPLVVELKNSKFIKGEPKMYPIWLTDKLKEKYGAFKRSKVIELKDYIVNENASDGNDDLGLFKGEIFRKKIGEGQYIIGVS